MCIRQKAESPAMLPQIVGVAMKANATLNTFASMKSQ